MAEFPGYGRLIHGETLGELCNIESEIVDAVVTDPPYSSGGFTRSDRNNDVAAKYQQSGTVKQYGSFSGDNRDGRSWSYWCALWLTECKRITKPGGYILMFCDWRQLPLASDSVQAGGWIWRGVVSWDKGPGARAPHKGYFRHQCEYVVWGTNGPLEVPPIEDPRDGPWAGSYTIPVRQDDKHHLTGKPTELMRKLVRCCPPDGLVLDPFAGSGTTLVAATMERRKFLGIEMDDNYFTVAKDRIQHAVAPGLFAGVP